MSDHLEVYRNPKGWVDFWIGLVVLIFSTVVFGRIWYQEDQIRKSDADHRAKIQLEINKKPNQK